MNKPSKERTLERLENVLEHIPKLRHVRHGSSEFRKWRRDTRVLIANAFGDESGHVKEFSDISYSPFMFIMGSDEGFRESYLHGLDRAEALLRSMIDEVREYWNDDEGPTVLETSREHRGDHQCANNVFVVHGRDEGTKSSVARFLEALDLVPVVLSELPAKGQTIIEKFESNADVEFAVALLTADDTGSLEGEDEQNPRARQNVIFELGFFIGRLGREKVCALTKGEPEIPSDYAGVEYIPLDEHGAWKMGLFKELRAAGFSIDADRLIGA